MIMFNDNHVPISPKSCLYKDISIQEWYRFYSFTDRRAKLLKHLRSLTNLSAEFLPLELMDVFEHCGFLPELLTCQLSRWEVREGLKNMPSDLDLRTWGTGNTHMFYWQDIWWDVCRSSAGGTVNHIIITPEGCHTLTKEECEKMIPEASDEIAFTIFELFHGANAHLPYWKKTADARICEHVGDNVYENYLLNWNGVKNFLTAYKASLELWEDKKFLATLRKCLGLEQELTVEACPCTMYEIYRTRAHVESQ